MRIKFGPFFLTREKPGVLAKTPVWVFSEAHSGGDWLYIEPTFRKLVRTLTTEWRLDKHRV